MNFIKLLALLITFVAIDIAEATAECPEGKYWVEPHFRRAYHRHDGSFVRSAHVTGHCRKRPRGYEKWHTRLSNNRPSIWLNSGEKSKKWTVEEVQRVLEAISVLPGSILDQNVQGVYRMDKSIEIDNSATTNFREIVLYDTSFDGNKNLARILAHEVSHIVHLNLPETKRTSYEGVARWRKVSIGKDKVIYLPPSGRSFVQDDGKSSPSEDFANNMEYFLFEPGTLKKKSGAIYEWIERNFGEDFKLKEQE